ncbi:hypothetical protein [Candidatus Odyssella thessalonicensis]|uniref:hypothetical protein n=1 Tax=Candidatus Odyssella thessalonicensis TaxID=84647 RepID=UPI000225C120|nr:hypothetical protein [Candidatus Odyssella thessalonicensis]
MKKILRLLSIMSTVSLPSYGMEMVSIEQPSEEVLTDQFARYHWQRSTYRHNSYTENYQENVAYTLVSNDDYKMVIELGNDGRDTYQLLLGFNSYFTMDTPDGLMRESLKELELVDIASSYPCQLVVNHNIDNDKFQKILQIIDKGVALPLQMAGELCEFMQRDIPFIRAHFAGFVEKFFEEVDKEYPVRGGGDAEEALTLKEQLAKELLQDLLGKIEQMTPTSAGELLYALAQRFEAAYGEDDYIPNILYIEILARYPKDHLLQRKVARLYLIKGYPREAAIRQATLALLNLPNLEAEDERLLQNIWGEKARKFVVDNPISQVNFQQSHPEIVIDLLEKYTQSVKGKDEAEALIAQKDQEIALLQAQLDEYKQVMDKNLLK